MADKSQEGEVFYSWSESDVIAVCKDIGTRCLVHAGNKQHEAQAEDKVRIQVVFVSMFFTMPYPSCSIVFI